MKCIEYKENLHSVIKAGNYTVQYNIIIKETPRIPKQQ